MLYALRFMVDRGLVGGAWVTLPAGKYALGPAPGAAPATHCQVGRVWCGLAASRARAEPADPLSHVSPQPQVEAHIHASRLVGHPPDGPWSRLAPLRVLSVDIECAGRKGHFPEAELDPVIQIASMVSVVGRPTPVVKNVMTLDTCAPIAGAEVMSFSDEKELLRRWRDLVVESDPDLIIGYNTTNFDLPYLLKRADTLRVPDFGFWGRVRKSRVKVRDTTFSSKAYGTRDMKEITIEGRVQLDLLTAIQRDHKLSSYSLNAVSAHFLGEQKEDVHHSIISDLQAGTAETRRRLAVYCLKVGGRGSGVGARGGRARPRAPLEPPRRLQPDPHPISPSSGRLPPPAPAGQAHDPVQLRGDGARDRRPPLLPPRARPAGQSFLPDPAQGAPERPGRAGDAAVGQRGAGRDV